MCNKKCFNKPSKLLDIISIWFCFLFYHILLKWTFYLGSKRKLKSKSKSGKSKLKSKLKSEIKETEQILKDSDTNQGNATVRVYTGFFSKQKIL